MSYSGRIIQRIGPNPTNYAGHEYRNSKIVEFEGRIYVVSNKAILTIVTTAACNSSCKFCSNEITFTPKARYIQWGHALEKIKAFCTIAEMPKVAFSGGEPTVNPGKLFELAKNIIPGIPKARIHTNGYGLLRPISPQTQEYPNLLTALASAGLNGVSLSIAHHNPATNNVIMKHQGDWKGLSDNDILQITKIAQNTGVLIRLSCVLTQDGIWSLEDILEYIHWGQSLGVKRFIFRSPSAIPEEYEMPTNTTLYARKNIADIARLISTLEGMSDFEPIFKQNKTDSLLCVFHYMKDTTIDIDLSSEEIDPDPKIRRLIMMPNQTCYTSWIDDKETLYSSFVSEREPKEIYIHELA